LYDRAAGVLPATQPTLRPGSPLARFDQRLSIGELAQDFSFGSVPGAPADERDAIQIPVALDPLAPVPREISSPPPGTAQQQAPAEQTVKGTKPQTARERQSKRREAIARDDAPKPMPPSDVSDRRKSKSPETSPRQLRARPVDATTDALPPEAPKQSPSVKIAESRSRDGSPPPPPRESAPATTRLMSPDSPDRREPASSPAKATSPESRPGPPAPAASTDKPATNRAAPVTPEPVARPLVRTPSDTVTLPEPAFDWSAVDRRIEAAVHANGKTQPTAPNRTHHPPSELIDGGDQATVPAFLTAAEASVIGSIESSSRHRMLFGTRWR